MITLKDIKISRNRIPVQNAIWLRPVGGLTFEINYPHGGDWQKISLGGPSPEPTPTPTPDPEIDELKEEVGELSQQMDTVIKSLSRIRLKIDSLNTNLQSLSKSVERLYKSVDITEIEITKTPPLGEDNRAHDILDYGIDNISLNSVIEGVVRKATVEGYERVFKVTTEKAVLPSGFIPYWLLISMVLKEVDKRIVIYLVGKANALVGGPLQIIYDLWREEQTIDSSVYYLESGIPKESKESIGIDDFTALLPQELVSGILGGTIEKVLFGTDTFEYIVLDASSDSESIYFTLRGYDEFENKTYVYECSGAVIDESWQYDIIYEEREGRDFPDDYEEN